MQVFYVGIINDNRPSTSEYGCGVEALVCAESPMDATVELRERGFTAVRARNCEPVEDGRLADGAPTPAVAPGDVWTRGALAGGDWEKR